jgi:uncharacterized membrane protein YukC
MRSRSADEVRMILDWVGLGLMIAAVLLIGWLYA